MSNDVQVRIKEAETIRANLHTIVDKYIDEYINGLLGQTKRVSKKDLSLQYMLSSDSALFKRKKPISLTFPDGRTAQTYTWRSVVTELMLDCCSDDERYKRLKERCDKIYGRHRLLFSSSPEKLQAPIDINGEFFVEGKFDVDTLMKVVTKNILSPVGYEFSNTLVSIRVKNQYLDEVDYNVECKIIEENEKEENSMNMSM